MTPTWGPRYWTVYLIAGAVLLLGPEIFALVTNWRNTLSDYVWMELKVQRDENPWNWSATMFLVFCVWMLLWFWLTFHFFFRRWT